MYRHSLKVKDSSIARMYIVLGAFDFTKLVVKKEIAVDPLFHETKHRYSKEFRNWANTKKQIEDKLGIKIHTHPVSGYCYFDMGLDFDIIRIYFDKLDDRIILKDNDYSGSMIDYLSNYFILKFIGDNELIQIKPYYDIKNLKISK